MAGDENEPVTLDPADPFDRALIPMVLTSRAKRQDYALDGDAFSNFRETAAALGIPDFGATESALFNVLQKLARLKALRHNGRMINPTNEAVTDTYLDLAVYAVILHALANEAHTTDTPSTREPAAGTRTFGGQTLNPGVTIPHAAPVPPWTVTH